MQQRFQEGSNNKNPGPTFAPPSFAQKGDGKVNRNSSAPFGRALRFKDGDVADVPGPHYDMIKSTLGNKAVRIGQERRFRGGATTSVPGPTFVPGLFSPSTKVHT